jgi:hypothetical protein
MQTLVGYAQNLTLLSATYGHHLSKSALSQSDRDILSVPFVDKALSSTNNDRKIIARS